MILHTMASSAFFLQTAAAPGVDWLYQFTNNLTNLTTQNGDALSSVGMSLLAFVSLIKLVRMVAQWNISTMTFSLSAQPVRIGDLVEFLLQLVICLLIINYWTTPFPGASFGFNHLFSYFAQVIVAALDQNSLNQLQQALGTALNSTPQPSYLAPLEILTYLLVYPNNFSGPHGFPLWVRYCHFFNFVFVMMLIRSGLSILVDHPRLYFNSDCTPNSEWIRMTPIRVPTDRVWTAKDDARYISPIVATPGYRHTVGIARSWHFLNVYGFIVTGFLFVIMLFDTEQWRRLVPQSPLVLLQAWNTWVHYATFHLPPELNGFYGYNALQQIAYFSVVFVFGPLAILTGVAMSPAVVNRFPLYAKLFGGRQSARSLHFLTMLGFFGFIVVHVTLIVMTGFVRNMNHIVMGTDDPNNRLGMILGFVGIGIVLLTWIGAHYVSWFWPRFLQRVQKSITYPLSLMTLNRLTPSQHYTEQDISPRFWPNGMMPVREDWKELAREGFRNYRLKVGGLVDNPVELSLADIAKMGVAENITMHHCIQGWTGIAKWGGLPMKSLVDLVRPRPNAKVVAFFSFGDSLYGVGYYDTQSLENVLKSGCLLATEMNGDPLTEVYGGPLRLRVENQLGYKMVKWIERIEFIESEKTVGLGEGGRNEDDEYFDLLPNI